MNYSDKLALIREYKKQGGNGSYLSVLQSYAEGGNLPTYDGKGDSQLPVRNFTQQADNTQYVPQFNGNVNVKNFPVFAGTLAPVTIKPSSVPYRNDVASRREDIQKIPITAANMKQYPISVQKEFFNRQVADRVGYEGIKDFANFAATGFGLAPMGMLDDVVEGVVGLGGKYIPKLLKNIEKTSTQLPNELIKSYYNKAPWTFKPNPNNYYRAGSKEMIEDGINSGIIRTKSQQFTLTRPDGTLKSLSERLNIGSRAGDKTYFSKGRVLDGRYNTSNFGDYIIEGNVSIPFTPLKPKGKLDYGIIGTNNIDELNDLIPYGNSAQPNLTDASLFNFYEPHWLKGYKKINKSK